MHTVLQGLSGLHESGYQAEEVSAEITRMYQQRRVAATHQHDYGRRYLREDFVAA